MGRSHKLLILPLRPLREDGGLQQLIVPKAVVGGCFCDKMAFYSRKLAIESALAAIRPKIFRTPVFQVSDMLLRSSTLGGLLDDYESKAVGSKQHSPIELFVKCENMQKSGSFKFRGALHALTQLPDQQLQKGIISYSTGNHAKALALASQLLAVERGYYIPVTIVMSKQATQNKVRAVADAKATVLQRGNSLIEARLEAQRVAKHRGLTIISPADNEDVTLGQGTVLLELIEQIAEMGVADLDAVVFPSGGGSLLAGSAIAAQGTGIEVFGSEPLANGTTCSNKLSFGESSTIYESNTVADCLRCSVSDSNRDIIKHKEVVRDVYSAPENDIRKAMALFINSTKMLIEPGSAVPLAIVLFCKAFRENFKKRERRCKVGVVLTGGNITLKDAHSVTSQHI